MRRICVFTGTRAEYGLLKPLMSEIKKSDGLKLQLIVSGMHMSTEFGLTYQAIEADGFTIDEKVEILLSSDTPASISKSMGVGLISYADILERLKPDLMMILGDRFEGLAMAQACMVAKIPIGHLHGGEATEGAIDESIRHSISKMSHLHFTSTETYRKRVIQLGEHPERVFNFGAIGIDNIVGMDLLSKKAFEASIDFQLGGKNILVTFHPVTLEKKTTEKQFQTLLKALGEFQDIHIIFTKANADTDGRIINQKIDDFVLSYPDRSTVHTSLGQLRYLSAMQYMDGVVGNSSSGIIEAPSFKIGTINIGDRQLGRIQAKSVINCDAETLDIKKALTTIFSQSFKEKIKGVRNPYGEGGTAKKIINVIKEYPLDGILKKHFFDLDSDRM